MTKTEEKLYLQDCLETLARIEEQVKVLEEQKRLIIAEMEQHARSKAHAR